MVRRIEDPKRSTFTPRASTPPVSKPRPTGHSTKSSLTADGAERARRAALTGAPTTTARTPEVVKEELVRLDRSLGRKGLNPGIRRELQEERQERATEYRQSLQQSIANLSATQKRLGADDARALEPKLAGYRAELAALGPTGTHAALAPTSTTASFDADAAAGRVSDAYESGGARAAMVELERQAVNLPPADAAKLIEASAPVIDRVAQDLMKRGDDEGLEQAVTSLSHAAKLAGPEATRQVATQLASAVTERAARGGVSTSLGNLDNGFAAAVNAGAGSDLAMAVQAELIAQGKPVSAGKIGDDVIGAINAPREAFLEAQKTYGETEARLAEDLAMFGPGLTPTERQKYVDAFWADPANKAVKDAYTAADTALARSLEQNGPALEAAAARGDREAAAALLDGMEALATSPNHAKAALDFVDRLGRAENKALFDALNHDGALEERLENDVLAPALGNAQSKAMTDGTMDEVLGTLKSIRSLGKNFKRLPGQVATAIETADKVAELLAAGKTGQEILSELRLDRLTDGWDGKSKLGKALAVFGVVNAMVKAGDTPDGLERLQASLSAIEGGLELTAGILGTMGRAQKLVGATRGAELLSKYLPFVGMVVNGAQLAEDIRTLADGGNAGDFIATAGTVVNLLGDVAGVVPILGTAVDGVLTTVGSILQGIGGLVSGFIEGNERREQRAEDRERFLTEAGVSKANRDLLLGGSLVDLSALGTMGLSRTQFLDVLRAQHALPTDDDGKSAYAVQMAWGAAAAYGLTGADAVRFVEQLQRRVVEMEWGELDRLNRALIDVSALTRGADHDGRTQSEIREMLAERLDSLDFIFQQTAGDVYQRWNLDRRDEDDVNLAFFTTWDSRG